MSKRIVSIAAWVLACSPAYAQQPGLFPAIPVKRMAEPAIKARDLSKYTPQQRSAHLSAVRALEWLQRANQPDGKFVPGFLPALGTRAEADPFLPQVDATAALLRASRHFEDEHGLALGKQALLRMLQETTTDAGQQVRFPSAPEAFVHRPAAAGALLRAIHEVPRPGDDLAIQARQLSVYLHQQFRPDGLLAFVAEDPAMVAHLQRTSSGPILAGLARNDGQTPSVDAVRKACPAYLAAWRQDKNPLMIPDHSAAYAEAFVRTRDPILAQAVFEMNDWLLTLQYPPDTQRSSWGGGFMAWQAGKAASLPPDASSAALACSLVEACRVAKLAGDLGRLQRYQQSLEASLRFLTTLQYTDARVLHFADWYRPWILGGFFRSHQDGNLHLQHHHHALLALVGYLEHVAARPEGEKTLP